MKLESKNIEDYLVSDMIVDWKTPEVRQKAIRGVYIRHDFRRPCEQCRCQTEDVQDQKRTLAGLAEGE